MDIHGNIEHIIYIISVSSIGQSQSNFLPSATPSFSISSSTSVNQQLVTPTLSNQNAASLTGQGNTVTTQSQPPVTTAAASPEVAVPTQIKVWILKMKILFSFINSSDIYLLIYP